MNDHDEEAVRHDEAATEDAAAEVATAQAALKAAEVETVAAEAAATVRIDDWIGTAWDMVDGGKEWHLGRVVEEVEGGRLKVDHMERVSKDCSELWKWPKSKDEVYVEREQVIRKALGKW